MSVDQAKAEMRRRTRVFVRRQANWFAAADPTIRWFTFREGIVDEVHVWLQGQLSR
jgi:tRNA dimethylallyltransferase